MAARGTLIFMCGKMAAGKSTLARQLASREEAILFVQDELLDRLYPGEIQDLADFVRCSSRLREALSPLIVQLLQRGATVILDFPGNTRKQRAWFRRLIEDSQADHALHFVDAPDERCKRQLIERSRDLPEGSPWTTEAEFDAITAYFEAPAPDEGFAVVRHDRNISL